MLRSPLRSVSAAYYIKCVEFGIFRNSRRIAKFSLTAKFSLIVKFALNAKFSAIALEFEITYKFKFITRPDALLKRRSEYNLRQTKKKTKQLQCY